MSEHRIGTREERFGPGLDFAERDAARDGDRMTVPVQRPRFEPDPATHVRLTGALRTRPAATAAALAATLGVAAVGWVVALRQMAGMDMGVATKLGSFAFFVTIWVSMMAAMILPGAVPAAVRCARASGRVGAAPLFAGSYLAVWTLVGLAVYAVCQPHDTAIAGALTVAAGLYELIPLKRACRRRCRESLHSGFNFGLSCVGSSMGLMVVLLALGAMSVLWMCVVAAIILAQKLLPPNRVLDVLVAFALVALGIVAAVTPAAIPGLQPTM